MYQGSCLCGTIKFTVSSAIENIIYCHCSLCRKAQGSAYATNGNVNAKGFNFLSGEDNLTAYQASATQTKYFCKTCGSPVMSKNSSSPEYIRIRLGTIESDITERPGAHIFINSKANWDEITDTLPQYENNITEE